jgi:lysozyme family protein
MPRVPQYQQQVGVSNLPSARIQNYTTAETLGADVAQAVGKTGGMLGQIAQQEQEKADVAALMDADRQLADLELSLFNDPENGAYAKRGRDAFGLPEQVFPQWDQQVGQIEGRLTPAQRDAFRRQAQGRRTDLQRGLSRHVLQESERFYSDEAKAYVSTATQSAAANYTDPERVDLEAERAARGILSMPEMRGASPVVVNAALAEARGRVYSGVVDRLMVEDPGAAVTYFDSMKDKLTAGEVVRLEPRIREARNTVKADALVSRALYGSGGFDNVVEQVLAVEGGYVANDAGKGETNFGINITANPDVDVRNLTPEKAKELYRERYWDAINADSLPPALQGIAFDAAVNQGPANARKWIVESGGDPVVYARLRRAHYAKLVEQDPEKYQQYAAGWEARVAKFEQAATSSPTEAGVMRALAAETDPDVRRLAESKAASVLRAKAVADAEAREATLEQAYAHIQGGGTIASMTPEMRSSINPLDLVKVETYERQRRDMVPSDRTAYNELADIATLTPQRFITPGFLEENRDKLDDDDYNTLLAVRRQLRAGQESEFVKSRQLQEEITRAAMVQIGYAQRPERVADPLKPKSGREEQVNDFREALAQRVDAFTQQNGKIPNAAEVQDIADQLLVKSVVEKPGWFGMTSSDEVPMFDQFPVSPRDPAQRVVGTVYLTPKGPLQWTGRAWREAPSE